LRNSGIKEESLAKTLSEIPAQVEHTWAWRAGNLMRLIGPLVKFYPAKTVHVALLKEGVEFPLIAGWALSRLVAWALFDQHESKRIPKPNRKTRAAKRPFKPIYAYKAGQLYLLYHADRFFREYDETARFRRITMEEVALAMTMYFGTGQIRKNFGHLGRTLSNLHNDKKRHQDLMFVYYVMDFLVRASQSGREAFVRRRSLATLLKSSSRWESNSATAKLRRFGISTATLLHTSTHSIPDCIAPTAGKVPLKSEKDNRGRMVQLYCAARQKINPR
jgi:hypothetical protein